MIFGDLAKQITTFESMLFHHLKFLFGQFPRLVQNVVWYRNLSYVMHNRCERNHLNLVLTELVFFRPYFHQSSQEQTGQLPYPLHMGAGFPTPEFDRCGQSLDDGIIQLVDLHLLSQKSLMLLMHCITQALSGMKQLYYTSYTLFHKIRNNWLFNNIHGTKPVSPLCILL